MPTRNIDLDSVMIAGKKKDLLSNFDLQALTITPAYVNTDGLGAESRTGDSMDVRTQRQQARKKTRYKTHNFSLFAKAPSHPLNFNNTLVLNKLEPFGNSKP